MPALDALALIDMRDDLAAIARRWARPTAQELAPRLREQFITFHYSAVAYADRSRTAEIQHIKDEAKYHIEKDWGRPGQPAFSRRYMYDFVVLTDGGIVRTDGARLQRWHCGNGTGNRLSWSVHVLLGGAQELDPRQRAALFALFDALSIDSQIARSAVVSHCEWPVGDGAPVPSARYQRQSGQSSCPGPILHRHIAAYRALSLPPALDWPGAGYYRVRRAKWVYQAPTTKALRARPSLQAEPFVLPPADIVALSDLVAGERLSDGNRWAKLSDNRGFVYFREADFERMR